MPRKQQVYTVSLGYEPVELLGLNPRRIKSAIYGDGWQAATYLLVGQSGQQTLTSTPLYLYYAPFIWEGENPLWVALPTVVSEPKLAVVVELLEL